jgi:hypothetical protein
MFAEIHWLVIATDTVVSKAGSGSGSLGVGLNQSYLVVVIYTGESVLCRVLYQGADKCI